MSQDVVSDGLNKIDNAIKARKDKVTLSYQSKLLVSILAIAKLKGYIKDYSMVDKKLEITLDKINKCQAIKPRFVISYNEIEKFIKRYLPAKNIGTIIVSTSSGIMTHQTAMEKKIGGCLLAYFY